MNQCIGRGFRAEARQDQWLEQPTIRDGQTTDKRQFGGKVVGDIYTYTYALQEHQPGDAVEIVVLRDGERLTLTAVLGDER